MECVDSFIIMARIRGSGWRGGGWGGGGSDQNHSKANTKKYSLPPLPSPRLKCNITTNPLSFLHYLYETTP